MASMAHNSLLGLHTLGQAWPHTEPVGAYQGNVHNQIVLEGNRSEFLNDVTLLLQQPVSVLQGFELQVSCQIVVANAPFVEYVNTQLDQSLAICGTAVTEMANQLNSIQNPVCQILKHALSSADNGGSSPNLTDTVKASESAEMRWLVRNSDVLSNYAGEWLLLRDEELLAHSRDFHKIKAAIAEHRIRSPFVYYVPTPQESNAISI